MQETSLHAALKEWYAQDEGRLEVLIEGYLVDVLRGDLLIEIQTRHFHALKTKLAALLEHHPVRLVHPIPLEKWIVNLPVTGDEPISRRKSPRRGRIQDLFYELIRIPDLINNPNFSLEILFIQEEEVRRADGLGSWRRKGKSIVDRRLVAVLDRRLFSTPDDFRTFLPDDLLQPFTVRQLANASGLDRPMAHKLAYCLRAMGVIAITGKHGHSFLYTVLPLAYNSSHQNSSSESAPHPAYE